jgi:ATP-dependent protease ClpP protease subunit
MDDIVNDIHNYCVNVKTREIYLNPYISSNEDDPGVDYRMSSQFIKNITHLDAINNKPILIHMYAIGGDWGAGMAIYDAISACNSYITIIGYSQAESMSSIILQSADFRVMTPYSYFMLHYGSSAYEGHYLNMQANAKFDKRCCDIMVDIYSKYLLKSKFFKESYEDATQEKAKNYILRKMKNGDWYLNAHECLYYGFCDSVLGDKKAKDITSLRNG